jgi:hypothetical protein
VTHDEDSPETVGTLTRMTTMVHAVDVGNSRREVIDSCG